MFMLIGETLDSTDPCVTLYDCGIGKENNHLEIKRIDNDMHDKAEKSGKVYFANSCDHRVMVKLYPFISEPEEVQAKKKGAQVGLTVFLYRRREIERANYSYPVSFLYMMR